MLATTSETSTEVHGGGLGDLVQLSPDHPGFNDEVYRRRRNEIARLALEYKAGAPVPLVQYTEQEQEVWRHVWKSLAPVHDQRACLQYLECSDRLKLDKERIPQLREVNGKLVDASGFSMLPVAGLVASRSFLGYLGRDCFLSTQYMRHPSTPLYTPEPDVVHELVGHAATLMHRDFARLNRAFGNASARVSDEALARIERVYWYTMEFGVVREKGTLKAFGAGLLSSFGELGTFDQRAKILPLDLEQMAALPYDPTDYQKVLFAAESFPEMADRVTEWLDRQ